MEETLLGFKAGPLNPPKGDFLNYDLDEKYWATFWNVSDRYSWWDNEPVRGRKNNTLLFEENLQPKKAYREVVDF